MMKKTMICILNYNGSQDTIECVKSIAKYEVMEDYTIVILDNDSRKEEKELLINELGQMSIKVRYCYSYEEYCKEETIALYDLVYVGNEDNVGFAKGNNRIIKPHKDEFDYVILLNNDTIMTSDSSKQLREYMCKNPEVFIASSIIYYYYDLKKIWNAGGKIFGGTRKYYTERFINGYKKNNKEIRVDYITGCYLCIRSNDVPEEGLLTEDFFMGEEDYNLALKAKNDKKKMVVLLTCSILHKVGASSKRELSKINYYSLGFVHHLNRFIDMKHFYTKGKWHLWRIIASSYIGIQVFGKCKKASITVNYIKTLNRLSLRMNKVEKEDYMSVRSGNIKMLTDLYKG